MTMFELQGSDPQSSGMCEMGLRPREGQTADSTRERSGADAFREHLEIELGRPVEGPNGDVKERKTCSEDNPVLSNLSQGKGWLII